MKSSLKVGIQYQHKFIIPKSKTVPNLYPESNEFKIMPEVFATGYRIKNGVNAGKVVGHIQRVKSEI